MTTTTFIGDIKSKDGDTDRLVSDLATVDEVNEAFTKYYDKTQCDSKFALKDDIGNDIDAYTKTECDSKFALKVNGYTEKIMSLSTSSYSSETTYNASVGDRFRLGTSIGGGAVNYYTAILTDEFKTKAGQKFEVGAYYFTITFNSTYTRLVFKPNSNELVLRSLALEIPSNVVYQKECDAKFATTYNPRYTTISTRTFKYASPCWDIQGTFGEHFMIKGTLNNKSFIFNDWIGYEGDSSTTILILKQTFNVYFGTGGCVSIQDNNKTIKITSASIVKSTEITTDVVYSDDLVEYMSKQSTTITHYAPIEEPIANYQIGYPTFMSGKVYKRVENNWIQSAPNDSTDCICSCITTGTSKTFAGVITSIDVEKNSITFATHGDYLFKVNDSSKYNVGDTICYDGSVMAENTVPTIAISQSIIGRVSSIIDSTTLSVFKTS